MKIYKHDAAERVTGEQGFDYHGNNTERRRREVTVDLSPAGRAEVITETEEGDRKNTINQKYAG